MSSEDLIQKLEELNATLGTIRDAMSEAGTDGAVENSLRELQVVSEEYRRALDGEIGRVIRMNRELKEQLGLIRDIVADSDDG